MNCAAWRPGSWLIPLTITLAAVTLPSTGHAVSIELRDVAPDRIERQRRAAVGELPLPGTPDLGHLDERLAAADLALGAPVLLRVFKAESELEVWMRKGDAYVLFATYPICHWSGTLGPKLHEGDKQSPEGFYTITRRQLHRFGRWHRALNIGYPNALDKSEARTGSYILVHGGCSSVGCFAMTNGVIEEIFRLVESALKNGQTHVPVHIFPFRMTDANLARYEGSEWREFWANLREGYDIFERTKRPPRVSVCDKRYFFAEPTPEEVGDPGPLAVCAATVAVIDILEPLSKSVPPYPTPPDKQSSRLPKAVIQEAVRNLGAEFETHQGMTPAKAAEAAEELVRRFIAPPRSSPRHPGRTVAATRPQATTKTPLKCSPIRASCRKWIAMQERKAAFAAAAAQRRHRTAARSR